MGNVVKADFKVKLNAKLKNFDPQDHRKEYQEDIFKELYNGFPQFKAHVAAYIERHYCMVVNDEDHADPKSLLTILNEKEVRLQNEWIVFRKRPQTTQQI